MAIMITQLTLGTMAIVSVAVDLLIMKVIIRAMASRPGQSDCIFLGSMVRIRRRGDAMRHNFFISMDPDVQRLSISSFHMERKSLVWFQELKASKCVAN